ncbi:MAG: roadblock/LC7 domain-containing protein [archaeon]
MPETKKARLEHILQKLKQTGDIEGAAVITRDGLMIASELNSETDGDTFAAMSATMTGAAETAIQELKGDSPERVIVESNSMKLITTGAGKDAILACIVQPKAKLGLILIEMRRTADNIMKEVR